METLVFPKRETSDADERSGSQGPAPRPPGESDRSDRAGRRAERVTAAYTAELMREARRGPSDLAKTKRHVVEVSAEGFQILDTQTEARLADVWASRTDAETAREELNRSIAARDREVPG